MTEPRFVQGPCTVKVPDEGFAAIDPKTLEECRLRFYNKYGPRSFRGFGFLSDWTGDIYTERGKRELVTRPCYSDRGEHRFRAVFRYDPKYVRDAALLYGYMILTSHQDDADYLAHVAEQGWVLRGQKCAVCGVWR